MGLLFPHMNPSDREAFLTDIKACDPAKFAIAWQGIQGKIASEERNALSKKLKKKHGILLLRISLKTKMLM